MKKITLNQRRFLIIWTCINILALIVNLGHIKGEISSGIDTGYQIDLLSSGQGIDEGYSMFHPDSFYPFTTKFTRNGTQFYPSAFLGIFNGYAYLEFVIYILLGIFIAYFNIIWGITPKIDERTKEQRIVDNKVLGIKIFVISVLLLSMFLSLHKN